VIATPKLAYESRYGSKRRFKHRRMKHLIEVDTYHVSRTGIALRASIVIAIVAATAHDRVITILAAAFIVAIAFTAIEGQKAKRSSANN